MYAVNYFSNPFVKLKDYIYYSTYIIEKSQRLILFLRCLIRFSNMKESSIFHAPHFYSL